MKIIMFSVRDDEEAAIRKWEKKTGVRVDINQLELNADTADQTQGYDGIVIQQRSRISDPVVYEKLEKNGLKQLSSRTAGYDMVDLEQASAHGLVVTNVPAYSPNSVAELALTQTMRLIRNLPLFDARGAEQDFRWAGLMAREIRTLTVGIIGAGRIGGTAARLFKALGATVIANDIVERDELKDSVTYVSKEELLRTADVVTLHVPLMESTTHLIDANALALMKNDAVLINASRGPVVDTDALIAALQNKQLAGAALDTLDGEECVFNQDLRGKALPSEQLKTLRTLPNVLITPHIGFYTNNAVKNMVEISLNDVLTIVKTGTSEHQVNKVAVEN
ncbi:D-2-hydroxyacid dehydrogenase [Sporolactobacillus terrae]|uniref:Bifunctional amino acid aminotransferase/2-hydroxyacid dehydrogenase n=1 Tax=Sporolactobacillus terrae TaxID=269673 RepID=A0ABX5Q477_9BACL|nr:D-2-hydroxyacid dehydrogenase [Sporolactobacillus terrae]QAA21446.1 bifunctional amino acid aminotransferase/2-hydroxyacid dehydrogenase [Sporolactobacillus terrae]QAA24418.1 bifunctional amino acid aminotransferase/2-hydroxyacid dehydrogenase [Sporolactobacillus terrae]UAK16245.1 D-2-hydroxyacid dehydrogenase [Sporolactobacillus terrae]